MAARWGHGRIVVPTPVPVTTGGPTMIMMASDEDLLKGKRRTLCSKEASESDAWRLLVESYLLLLVDKALSDL